MKILIVDDSRAMQAIVRRAVTQVGLEDLEIQTAASGKEALDLVLASPPDLVLTDWHMPEMSGLEMLQAIRQLGHADLHVGFLTTETQPDRLEEARHNGASFILNKPFTDEALRLHVEQVMSALAARASRPVASHLDAFSALIRSTLKQVPFRLVDKEMTVEHLTHQNLLALYRQGRSATVSALGVMDIQCVTMIGAGSTAMMPAVAKPLIQAGQCNPEMLKTVSRLMREAASLIGGAWSPPLEMQQHSLVSRDFAKLHDLFKNNKGLAAFRLDIPGYGSGRMAFFVV